jgi:UDP-N-acetylmuramoyl-L-alanyl-D-glutamate--2,6-diaminopimelate ligase
VLGEQPEGADREVGRVGDRKRVRFPRREAMRVGSAAVPGYPRPTTTAGIPLRDLAITASARIETVSDIDRAGAVVEAGEVLVFGTTHDSSAVSAGDLYAALPGSRRHGAEFAAAVRRQGAVAVLTDVHGSSMVQAHAGVADLPVLVVDNPRAVLGQVASTVYGDPTGRLPVIGITGTAGKTSTAYLVESGLRAAGHTTCMIGTVETRVADMVVDSVRTTPEATDLHALFAAALERGATAAVMEVSSHALSYGRVGGVTFAVGGWTNFGLDHLDFHADADDYFSAKAKLFDGRCRAEVLNLDDSSVRALLRPGRVSFSAGGDPAADWRALDIARDGFAQTFTVLGPDGLTIRARVALPGRHNVANALLAIALLVEAGVDAAAAAKGVSECRGVPGRLELVDAPGPVLGVVDYAHKPDAIVAALAALRDLGTDQEQRTDSTQRTDKRGRLICVIGAGGDRDRGKRRLMGEAAARGADFVVVTDDNPRSEEPAAIRAEVRAGAEAARSGVSIIEVAGRRTAIAAAVGLAEAGDVVALLGKGHETGQEVDGVTSPFDDRIELAAALARRFAGVPA